MNLFKKCDDWFFDKIFEPSGHWCQTHFGKNCFFLAKMMYAASILTIFVSIFTNGRVDSISEMNERIIENVYLILISICALRMIKDANSQEQIVMAFEGKMNSRRLHWHFRVTFIVVLLAVVVFFWKGGLSEWIALAANIFFLCGIYYTSCTPLPPNRLRAGNKLAAEAI